MVVAMKRRMLRRASVAILFLVLVPQSVHAFDHHVHEHHFGSDGGGGCGGSSASAPAPSTASHKRIFVTSTTYTGSIGGARAADAECGRRAATRGFTGVFRAWLSDGAIGAYDRTSGDGPWYTTSDALAFSGKADLQGAPQSELLDEYGGHPDSAGIWSGSDSAGGATGHDCAGWTSDAIDATGTAGSVMASDVTWGGGGSLRACNVAAPLVCVQQ